MKVLIQLKGGLRSVDINRRKAIRERCLNCSAWSPKEVKNCHFTDCVLYPFRTGKGKQPARGRNKAIREYCLWCCNNQPKEVRLYPSVGCSLHSYRTGKLTTSSEPSSFVKNIPQRRRFQTSDDNSIPLETSK